MKQTAFENISKCRPPVFIASFTIMAILLVGCASEKLPESNEYLVGAYYYLWYPRNFSHGFLRGRLTPQQVPELGLYDSREPHVAEQHIRWASSHGIDFFLLSWWPSRDYQNKAIDTGFLQATNIGDIRFSIFFETQDLGHDSRLGITLMDEKKIELLVDDVSFIAEQYFSHPSYLHIDGRPVIVFYLTRTIHVNHEKTFRRIREALEHQGYDPFIIGDEIFWKVTQGEGNWEESDGPFPMPVPTKQPQWDRIALFDAITAYNVYEGGNPEHSGYASESAHIPDVAALYEKYSGNVPVVPTVLPGYNDRGVRLSADNYAIPRQWRHQDKEASLFARYLEEIAWKHMDGELRMFFITSWNEWNEDTAIEPLLASPPANQDQSPDGRAYTQGYDYAGHGLAYLEVLRNALVSVSGRVADQQGHGLEGVEIGAWNRKGVLRSSVSSNSEGLYSFSRQSLSRGKFKIGPVFSEEKEMIVVNRGETITGVDFYL